MAEHPGEDPTQPGARPPRVGIVLMVMVLLGLPFVITSQVLQASLDLASAGEQPGGEIAGLVVTEDGREPLADVPVVLHATSGEGSPSRELLRTTTGADGRFSLLAPAFEGFYRVHVGGGELRRVVRNFSFLDGDGELDVELGPGAVLSISHERSVGGRITGGDIYLDAKLSSGSFRFFSPTLRMEDRFEGSAVRIDGLPPISGRLRIELDGGEQVELEFELEEGEEESLAYTI